MSQDSPKKRADALHEEGMTLDDAGQTDLALKKYFDALALDIARPTTHYNIGLIYKYRKQWPESLRYNKRAVELAPDDEAASWNLAIAATALRDWKTAREVWHRLGMPIEKAGGPIAANFGVNPVRLCPEADAEVVWGRRIDPVRIQLLSIPLPNSGFRYHDVVLHDGAAVGYRLYEGVERPVFNLLELFEKSTFATFEAELVVSAPADLEALEAQCDKKGIAFEDWTSSLRNLCKECSEGKPHEQHAHKANEDWQDTRRVAFAATEESNVRHVLKRWQNRDRMVGNLERVLDP